MKKIWDILQDLYVSTDGECGQPVLYSPILGKVKVVQRSEENRTIRIVSVDEPDTYIWTLDEDGKYTKGGECVIYPSATVRDWGLFLATYMMGTNDHTKNEAHFWKACSRDWAQAQYKENVVDLLNEKMLLYMDQCTQEIKVAYEDTPEYDYLTHECPRLYFRDDNPDNGHEYMAGDVVVVDGVCFSLKEGLDAPYQIGLENLEEYPNLRHATKDEIMDWNWNTLHEEAHAHYRVDLGIFVHWFQPFEKVLVRYAESCDDVWIPDFFGLYTNDPDRPYATLTRICADCIPYNESSKKLLGTNKDAGIEYLRKTF